MEKIKYSTKLLDPRWQKKRLQVLERDEWHCIQCGDDESTLHVHHLSYTHRCEPWDYPLENFTTLCQSCHEAEYEYRTKYEKELLDVLRSKGFAYYDVDRISQAFSKLKLAYPPEVVATIIEFSLTHAFQAITNWYWDDLHRSMEQRKAKEVSNG